MTGQMTLTSSTPQTLAAGQEISGSYPGVINTYTLGVANTFSNAGTIIDTSTIYEYPQATGILLTVGTASTPESINNTGTIKAFYAGIVALPDAALATATSIVITNSGIITATGSSDSDRTAGIFTGTLVNGTVINNSTGTIWGPEGVFLYNQTGGTGTVINHGTIAATEPTAKGGYYAVEIQSTSGSNLTGSAVLQNYGVISGTVDLDVANATVLNAGTVTGLIVVFGTGTLTVDPGASSAEGLFAGAGSELILASAATAGDLVNPGHYTGFQNIVVAAGADWTIGSAGTVAGFGQIAAVPTITNLGTTNVQGTLTTTLNTSGITNVLSGGQINSGAVQSGGVVNVKSGGAVSGGVIDQGGQEIVFSGGVQSGGTDSGVLTLSAGGQSVNNTVANGGFEYVSSGGNSDNSVVSSGGTEVIYGGGTVSGVTVYNSGTLIISSGGVASNVTIAQGATISLLSGGQLSNYTLAPGATLGAEVYISSGGFISSLGSATSGYAVPHGYAEVVASGGMAISSLVTSTTSVVAAGGTVSGTNVSNGGRLIVASGQSAVGRSVGAIVSSGGIEIVSGNGSVSSSAVASGSLVLSGGTEFVEADGVETGGTVSAHGAIDIAAGGLAVGETLAPNAIMTVDAGGLADATVVSNHAGEIVQGNGAVGSGSMVLSGGTEFVQAGGVERGGTVASDGALLVSSGGTALGETVLAGGAVNVSDDGVVSGGVVSGSVLLSAGTAFVPGGAAYGGIIEAGGLQAVQSGAITSGTSIAAGGVLLLQTGALTSGSLVDNGQIRVTNTLISASGVTTLAGTGTITGAGTLSISAGVTDLLAGAGSTIALTGSIADAGTIVVGAGALFSDTGSISGGGVLSIASGAAATLAAGSLASVLDAGTLIVTGNLTAAIDAEGYGAGSVIDFTGTAGTNASINHFGAGDTIMLGGTGLTGAVSGETYNNLTGVLSFTDSGNGEHFNLTISPATAGTYSAADFTLGALNGVVDITTDIPCFAAGTRILGVQGDILVEDICPGDELVTVREGGPVTRKVVWTGKRAIDIARHPRPDMVRPVRIIAGAFGDNVPERDVRLSPLHAVYVNGCLFEAISLVNGTTIYQEQATRYVTYHHIELEAHDVLLAEGLPAESFLDTGDRTMFESVSGVTILHPDFATPEGAQTCAPMIRAGADLDQVRAELNTRIRKRA